jgi:hypothetical protein
MFVAEPVLLDCGANVHNARPSQTLQRLFHGQTESARVALAERPADRIATLAGSAGSIIRRILSATDLLSWHRSQRSRVGPSQVSARAWRRQSALICLQAGLEIEARR